MALLIDVVISYAASISTDLEHRMRSHKMCTCNLNSAGTVCICIMKAKLYIQPHKLQQSSIEYMLS